MSKIGQTFRFLIPVIAFAVLIVFMTGCESREKVKEEKNKSLTRRHFEEVWNQGKLDVINEIFATEYIGHTPGSPDIHGPEGLKQFVTMHRTAFPDIHFTVEDQIAEGDKVVIRWKNTITHKGELMGVPPTGKQATQTGISFFRISGGKIVERWLNRDALGMMQQLGFKLVPPPRQSEE